MITIEEVARIVANDYPKKHQGRLSGTEIHRIVDGIVEIDIAAVSNRALDRYHAFAHYLVARFTVDCRQCARRIASMQIHKLEDIHDVLRKSAELKLAHSIAHGKKARA
jgi:hypothetical protein